MESGATVWIMVSLGLFLSLITLIFLHIKVRALHQKEMEMLTNNFAGEVQRREDYIAKLESLGKESENAFQALSSQALQRNNQLFMQLAQTSFSELRNGAEKSFEYTQTSVAKMVEPLIESLKDVNQKISELEKNRVGAYEGLREQVNSLVELQKQLSHETTLLSTALRTPTGKGRWGELQLRRVVEIAGLLEHCDFETQVHLNNEEGSLRPDMVVRLPGQKQIIVDAKAPITHYIDAIAEKDEQKRREKLELHTQSIRRHMQSLSQKSYWEQFENTPEFVVMFLPGEVFFSAALEKDPSLIEKGIEQRVILATPTTLIALLRAVAFGWQQENMSQSAKVIADIGKQLLKRLYDYNSHFQDIGKHLQSSVRAYNRAVGTLDSRVLVTARKLAATGLGEENQIVSPKEIDLEPKSMRKIAALEQEILLEES